MKNIKQDQKNVRKHDARNKQVIFDSLKELGAGRSILIDAADTAVAAATAAAVFVTFPMFPS